MTRRVIVPKRGATLRWGLVMLAVTLALVALIGGAGRYVPAQELEFSPIPGLDGWRRLDRDGLRSTGGGVATLGLGAAASEADLGALHAAPGPGVPVAMFSDYACPNCPALAGRLRARAARGEIALTVHHLGRLGSASEAAALVGAAAALEGAAGALDRRLYRTRFVPNAAWTEEVADLEGLDGYRIARRARSDAAWDVLAEAEALARRLGVAGTPSLVVGRTLVVGEPRAGLLDALLAAEAAR